MFHVQQVNLLYYIDCHLQLQIHTSFLLEEKKRTGIFFTSTQCLHFDKIIWDWYSGKRKGT